MNRDEGEIQSATNKTIGTVLANNILTIRKQRDVIRLAYNFSLRGFANLNCPAAHLTVIVIVFFIFVVRGMIFMFLHDNQCTGMLPALL